MELGSRWTCGWVFVGVLEFLGRLALGVLPAVLGFLAGLTVPVFGGSPVWIMIGVTAFQSTMMPLVTLAILVLINREKLMGEYKAGLWLNLGITATLAFAVFAAVMGIRGLLGI